MEAVTPSRWWLACLLLVVSTVGCAQPGAGGLASQTAPSSLASDTLSALPQASVARAAPVPSYDANGLWLHVVRTAEKQGTVFDGPVITQVTQGTDGVIRWCGECEGELWELTPLGGAGRFIRYSLLLTVPGACVRVEGTASLDTTINQITGVLLPGGIVDEETCSKGHDRYALTLTKQ